MSEMSQPADPQLKARIKQATGQIVEQLSSWAQRYPSVRASRLPTIALLTATALPESRTDAVLAGKTIAWLFLLDDLLDERLISLEEAALRRKRYEQIARGEARCGDVDDQLAWMLQELRDQLLGYQFFQALCDHWALNVGLCAEAMIKEYQDGLDYQRTGRLPDMEEYLRSGVPSVGFPLWGATLLIIFGSPRYVAHTSRLVEVIYQAGAAARLYNDIRSFERELSEGGVNSLLIAMRPLVRSHPDWESGQLVAQAKALVLQQADHHTLRVRELIAALPGPAGLLEQAILRVVDFHSYYYGRSQHDYHLATLASVHEIIENHLPGPE